MHPGADLKNRFGAQMWQSRSGVRSTHGWISRQRGVSVIEHRVSSISPKFEHPNHVGTQKCAGKCAETESELKISRRGITIEAKAPASRRFCLRTGLDQKFDKVGRP